MAGNNKSSKKLKYLVYKNKKEIKDYVKYELIISFGEPS